MFVYRRTGLDELVAVVGDVWGIVAVVKLDDHPLLPAPKDVVMVHRAQDNLLGLISLSGDDLNRDSLSYSIFRSGLGALGRDTRASEAVDVARVVVVAKAVVSKDDGTDLILEAAEAHLAHEAVVVVVAKAVVSEAGEDVLALGISLGGVDLLSDEGALLLKPGGALLVLDSVVLLLMNIFLNSPRNIHTALLWDDVTLVLVTLLTLLPHIRCGLTLPLELSLALPLGLCVLNRPLRNLTLPLVDVGVSVVSVVDITEASLGVIVVVLEAGEALAPEAVIGEAVDAAETDVGVVDIADAIFGVVVVAEAVVGGADVAGDVVDDEGGTELILEAVLREAAVGVVDVTRAMLGVVVVANAVVSEAGEAIPDLEAVVREAGGALLTGTILK